MNYDRSRPEGSQSHKVLNVESQQVADTRESTDHEKSGIVDLFPDHSGSHHKMLPSWINGRRFWNDLH